jgi:PIN domain nuclease of toxin-antitoxin system
MVDYLDNAIAAALIERAAIRHDHRALQALLERHHRDFHDRHLRLAPIIDGAAAHAQCLFRGAS